MFSYIFASKLKKTVMLAKKGNKTQNSILITPHIFCKKKNSKTCDQFHFSLIANYFRLITAAITIDSTHFLVAIALFRRELLQNELVSVKQFFFAITSLLLQN